MSPFAFPRDRKPAADGILCGSPSLNLRLTVVPQIAVKGRVGRLATTIRTRGLVLTEHEFSVPLDHSRPDGDRITVFAREVADPDGLERPYLVFLQGGPGNESPRPTRFPSG